MTVLIELHGASWHVSTEGVGRFGLRHPDGGYEREWGRAADVRTALDYARRNAIRTAMGRGVPIFLRYKALDAMIAFLNLQFVTGPDPRD